MKNKIILFGIILLLILLTPIKVYYKDGGSVGYKAILYEVINYASLDGNSGIGVKVLGQEVYSNEKIIGVMAITDNSDETIKLKDSVVIFNMNEDTWEKDSKKEILKLKDKEGLNLFNNLIKNATKIDKILDMKTPRYIGEVTLGDRYEGSIGAKTETIIFDINHLGGLYCEANETNIWYSFDSDDVSSFMKYLDKINVKL